MESKKWVSLTRLEQFLGKLKTIFATKAEVNSKADADHVHEVVPISVLEGNEWYRYNETYKKLDIALSPSIEIPSNKIYCIDKDTCNVIRFFHTDLSSTLNLCISLNINPGDHLHLGFRYNSNTRIASVIFYETTGVLDIEFDSDGNKIRHESFQNVNSSSVLRFLNNKTKTDSYVPSLDTDVVTKEYVDDNAAFLSKFVVTLSSDDWGKTFTADKTFAQIQEAYNAGKSVSALYVEEGVAYNYSLLCFYPDKEVEFLWLNQHGQRQYININSSNVIQTINSNMLDDHSYKDLSTNSSTVTGAINEINAKVDVSLTEAKTYADLVKNDLLNGAGEAYDTLKELGDLIDDNQDAITALETVAVNKADKTLVVNISSITVDSEETYSADKTFAEIEEAYNAGTNVVASLDGILCQLYDISGSSQAVFMTTGVSYDNTYIISATITIDSSNTVDVRYGIMAIGNIEQLSESSIVDSIIKLKEDTQTSITALEQTVADIPTEVLTVNITSTTADDGTTTYSADKTFDEIKAAYDAGTTEIIFAIEDGRILRLASIYSSHLTAANHDASSTRFVFSLLITSANKVSYRGIDTLDSSLSTSSAKAVQNKVITAAINEATSAISANTSSITSHTSAIADLQTKVGDGFEEVTSEEIQALFA